jgi:energy-coupling factor transporter ATP-binding protein EcfA2
LPEEKSIIPKGLILIVGPNSSGKTQLLKDVHQSILGQPRTLVVASRVGIKKPQNFDVLIQSLENEGYLRKEIAQNGAPVIRAKTSVLGGSIGIPAEIDYQTAAGWFNSFNEGQKNQSSQQFYSAFGAMLSTALFLVNRLTATNRTNNYDYETQPPTNDVQALYFSSSAKEELTRVVKETFGKSIWLDPTRANILCFRVTDTPDLPPPEDRFSPDKVTKYRVFDDEGDGIRSFVAISMCLALSRRPVCLIDEPETCLHPPQAYAIGRVIAQQARKHTGTTLVATHSSHVLRGVIQETKEVQIIRLTRAGGRFFSHLVDSKLLASAIEKPLVRAETIFDGIFADGVVLVESDADRAVYQAVWESTPPTRQLDLLFVPLNGKGAMADVAKFFKALHIPVAIIPDLDLIKDDGVIPKILAALSAETEEAIIIQRECRQVTTEIRNVPPTISPDEVRAEMGQILKLPMDWHNNDDETVMRQLRQLAYKVERMRKLKKGGIPAYETAGLTEIASQLKSLKEKFWKCGVFIVPVGELEFWLSEEFMKNGPGRDRKQEYADEAANRIRKHPIEAGEINKFIASVAEFIAKKEAGEIPSKQGSSEVSGAGI